MQPSVHQAIEQCAKASNSGAINFGDVVKALLDIGIESYHADYRTQQTTYYLPDGDTLSLELPGADGDIADDFNQEAIKAAIRGSQHGEIMYPEFKRLSQAGGCVGYIVWLRGRHVSYFGRGGEVHNEHFPAAK